ncbi:uncharacterized protein LOC124889655 [Capsicum annuum]|uniref:uncharacterized protein LOC124889655 n=1 Tax=Capsicum annuum TaxID=4072 RepID=UPI001FB0781D|nr:uncharacterized protein LOC124889655 [Capsicum annuum]
MDGQAERTIQTLEDMLRACAFDFRGSWDENLPLIEFAYDNNYHTSIQMAPFVVLYERWCRSPIAWFEVAEVTIVGPDTVFEAIEKVNLIRERLKIAHNRQKSYADVRKDVGDCVVVNPSEIPNVQDSLSFDEVPVEILDHQVRKLRNKKFSLVKVLWRNKSIEGATWEAKDDIKTKYPYLFSTNPDQHEGIILS